MNKLSTNLAFAGLGFAGAAGVALIAGCHSHRDAPAPMPAAAPPIAAVAPPAAPAIAQTTAFQPYTLINQPPPIPIATTHRHRTLRIATYHRQVYLADNDGHYYNVGRDQQGHLYPVYHDPVTNRAYPLYYDQDHDDYYRMIRTDDGDYYRNYVGTQGNDYYRAYNPAPGTPAAGGSGYIDEDNNGDDNGYNYNPYSPPPACLPQVYQPDGALYAPQSSPYIDQDQPNAYHSHGTQDWWLLAIPVVIGAYLLLNQHHHSSGSGYYDNASGYYAGYPNGSQPEPGRGPGGRQWNTPGGYGSVTNSYTRNVSTTIINNNQRTTNIYTISPPPQAIARQPYQASFNAPFATTTTAASQRPIVRSILPPTRQTPFVRPVEQARVRPGAAPSLAPRPLAPPQPPSLPNRAAQSGAAPRFAAERTNDARRSAPHLETFKPYVAPRREAHAVTALASTRPAPLTVFHPSTATRHPAVFATPRLPEIQRAPPRVEAKPARRFRANPPQPTPVEHATPAAPAVIRENRPTPRISAPRRSEPARTATPPTLIPSVRPVTTPDVHILGHILYQEANPKRNQVIKAANPRREQPKPTSAPAPQPLRPANHQRPVDLQGDAGHDHNRSQAQPTGKPQ